MLKQILSITGKPGLFKMVTANGHVLVVEDIKSGKRFSVSPREKVISLGDVAMYTIDEDKPLPEIFEACYKINEGKPLDLKSLQNGGKLSEEFGKVLPEYDRDRVYQSDIKKMFTWYNALLEAGFTSFVESKEEEKETPETDE